VPRVSCGRVTQPIRLNGAGRKAIRKPGNLYLFYAHFCLKREVLRRIDFQLTDLFSLHVTGFSWIMQVL